MTAIWESHKFSFMFLCVFHGLLTLNLWGFSQFWLFTVLVTDHFLSVLSIILTKLVFWSTQIGAQLRTPVDTQCFQLTPFFANIIYCQMDILLLCLRIKNESDYVNEFMDMNKFLLSPFHVEDKKSFFLGFSVNMGSAMSDTS